LQLREQGWIGPRNLDRRTSAFGATREQLARVVDHDRLAPHERHAVAAEPHGDRFRESSAWGKTGPSGREQSLVPGNVRDDVVKPTDEALKPSDRGQRSWMSLTGEPMQRYQAVIATGGRAPGNARAIIARCCRCAHIPIVA
jgi:hypothetical protein